MIHQFVESLACGGRLEDTPVSMLRTWIKLWGRERHIVSAMYVDPPGFAPEVVIVWEDNR